MACASPRIAFTHHVFPVYNCCQNCIITSVYFQFVTTETFIYVLYQQQTTDLRFTLTIYASVLLSVTFFFYWRSVTYMFSLFTIVCHYIVNMKCLLRIMLSIFTIVFHYVVSPLYSNFTCLYFQFIIVKRFYHIHCSKYIFSSLADGDTSHPWECPKRQWRYV